MTRFGNGVHPPTVAAAVVVIVGLVLAGCTRGADETGTSGATPTPVPTTTATAPGVTPTPDPVATSEPTPTPTPTPTAPVFTSRIALIDDALAERMQPSWWPGCPVPLEDLRYVTVTYVDFDGVAQEGELVVHADVADGIVGAFARLYELGYPIRSMRLVDDFDADDDASMAADNTSAFNCRAITGGTGWSEHAYGRAIDVNPVENPYVRGSHVAPPAGAAFVDRTSAHGVILADDEVVRAFAAAGWLWGGDWERPIDYQHFSTTGR
ncbi:M15 family metallopeptidase [Cellulomonas composti]|uniref:Peptidase M15C domain-containing protein n=1 Tax=Cellulomonas composti TaxID=266130 RepID=A0A511JD46_9CELL|nr:M15 family metallopeptidase [Cellulomonas composti]GEL95894.1 hypothetical protein CCO02nite_25520 [Cellulomonas composti]